MMIGLRASSLNLTFPLAVSRLNVSIILPKAVEERYAPAELDNILLP